MFIEINSLTGNYDKSIIERYSIFNGGYLLLEDIIFKLLLLLRD